MTERVTLRHPREEDRATFLAAAQRSTRLHHPWVDPPKDDEGYDQLLASAARDDVVSFLAWVDDGLVGVVNLNNIILGRFRNAFLGYYGFDPHAGRGLVREAVARAMDHAFDEIVLHRLEANIQPGNERSLRLVRALGFRKEGFSPRYLYVDDAWRDHERWAILADEWPAARPDPTALR